MDDGSTRILAEGENALDSCLGIAQKLQCHILVVLRSLGVGKYLGHLLVVLPTQLEFHIVERLLGQPGQGFLGHFQDGLSLKLSRRHPLGREKAVLSVVFAQLEHWGILECYVSHSL